MEEIVLPYSVSDFETLINDHPTTLFTLKNNNGMLVTLTNYGAKIVSIYVPDREGKMADVVLGFRSVADYQQYGASHGATVGPFANRIGNARFTIDGEDYFLAKNNGENCLHSGPETFSRRVWNAAHYDNTVAMAITSPDGEYGFPGNKTVKVTFQLNDENELRIDYEATTDKATHFNLTNHSYFNLRGEGNGDILGHIVHINANYVTPVDDQMIPTGEIADIRGTDLDFTKPATIGSRIDNDHPQLKIASGYDFNYVIKQKEGEIALAARVLEPESGRIMEVYTSEPGVQFFTGNRLPGTEIGKSGVAYGPRSGFCLETQHFPDSPNKPDFPSTLLRPGELLHSTTIFRFDVKPD